MRGSIYDNWVKSLKEGDLVLAIDNHWSSPVIFLSWNGVNSKKNSRNDISLVTGLEGEGGKGDYRGIGEGGVENGDY